MVLWVLPQLTVDRDYLTYPRNTHVSVTASFVHIAIVVVSQDHRDRASSSVYPQCLGHVGRRIIYSVR